MKGSVFFKKIISLSLAFAMVFSLASCIKERTETDITKPYEEEEAPLPGGSLAVPYTSGDSLNPFYSESVSNSALISLVHRSLYYLDTSFMPVKDLAESENTAGLTVSVKLIKDLVFSDGSPVTAEDVVYSFECAKPSFLYSELLSGIEKAEAGDNQTAVFTLSHPDVNILNCLTFPIVKKGTATTESSLPAGCGYYRFTEDGIRLSLSANLKYAGTIPAVGTVRLVDITDTAIPERLVDTGEIDFCYSDLADADTNRVYSSVTNVYLNNLVYMGVNSDNINLKNTEIRQALSLAINRQSITENAYRGYARAAFFPFNTSWKKMTSSSYALSFSPGGDSKRAQEILSSYNIKKDGNSLVFNLLCSDSNSFVRNTATAVASMLAEYNIIINITTMTPENLSRAVKNGEYDLYIAEFRIPGNMNLSEFFKEGGRASYGMDFSSLLCDDIYFAYRSGDKSGEDFLSAFAGEMPFIPLLFRNGRFCYTRSITSAVSSSMDRIYGDFPHWTYSENGR